MEDLEYTVWESDGRFGVSFRPATFDYTDGSLGRGGGDQITVFHTIGERQMYISLSKCQRELKRAAHERDHYADMIREMSKDGLDGFLRRAWKKRERRLRREARSK